MMNDEQVGSPIPPSSQLAGKSLRIDTLAILIKDANSIAELSPILEESAKAVTSGVYPDLLILHRQSDAEVRREYPVTFFPIKDALLCVFPNGHQIEVDFQGQDNNITAEKIKARNKLLKLNPPREQTQEPKILPPRVPRADALRSVLHFTNDNIHSASITAFARAADWQPGEKYFRGLEQEYKNLNIAVYLPDGDKAASLWDFLKKGGAAMVKAHYALWARYYEQVPDGLSLEYVVVNINDFCRDLGYAKAKNGGYKPEAKRRAMQLLEALTITEMAATYQVPGQKQGHTKTRRLKGRIWTRGLEGEERDTYEDLLGNARAGVPEQWTPHSFSFAPGPWHADREWRQHNKYVGKIGAGLMRLRCDKDEWAILIGGYLGALARIGQYRKRRLLIKTVLQQTGLGAAIGHRHAQFREKFYRALDRLQEEGVIKSYRTDGFDDSDVDPDDLGELAAYGQRDPYPPGDWRTWIVEIEFDFAADTTRLEARETKAIEAKKRKSQRRHKTKKQGD